MELKTSWYCDQNIAYIAVAGAVIANDILKINRCAVQMVDSCPASAHLIIDTRGVSQFPSSLRWLSDFMSEPHVPSSTRTVILHNNNAIRLMGLMVLRRLNLPFYACTSLEAAVAYLQRIQPSLGTPRLEQG